MLYLTGYGIHYRYIIYDKLCYILQDMSAEWRIQRDWTLLLGKKRQRLRLFTKVAKLMLTANDKTTGLHLLSQRYVISARNY